MEEMCTNIFKDGQGTTTKEKYTAVWIKLINQCEKSKSVFIHQEANES